MQFSGTRLVLVMATFGLAACQPAVPDSGAGVGFTDYAAYEQSRIDRDAALRRGESVFPQGTVDAPATPPAPARQVISTEDLRAAGLPTGAATTAAATPPVSTQPIGAPASAMQPDLATADPITPGAPRTSNPGISDEQDFGAVSERQTIESDAERIARQRAAYEVVQPTAVPARPGSSAPNIVAFALSTTNAVGQKIYNRSGFNAESKFLRACASYSSSDRAQEDFLKNGGPQKDSKGVDPDGDGFACYWDPTPFRKVAQN
ncbi:hypothetical protein [Oceaniglobus ichthyenteri]|uniref:hypothetical protein n=1 Tax=Oceaniglobus ichthyenteri TaxID=2136177 RepID=UPI000D3B2784|nr:hypothetical protein [Oceaniglobus ichthyenteri]